MKTHRGLILKFDTFYTYFICDLFNACQFLELLLAENGGVISECRIANTVQGSGLGLIWSIILALPSGGQKKHCEKTSRNENPGSTFNTIYTKY